VGLSNRLKRLEEHASASEGWRMPRYLEAYFRAIENLERKEASLPPLDYTEGDRRDDEEFLRETLPFYRANLGWQREEAQSVLDEWENHTRQKLEKGQHY
jgi:hypothetical protein